jgi:hypothetical protein
MPTAADNKPELVEVYAEQIAAVAKRLEADENVQHELEDIISKAVADFGRTEGVSQIDALRSLADRLDHLNTTASHTTKAVFATGKEMALHKIHDPSDLV